jgi:hypothetical protein
MILAFARSSPPILSGCSFASAQRNEKARSEPAADFAFGAATGVENFLDEHEGPWMKAHGQKS